MKWLALVLVALNGMLWFTASWQSPSAFSQSDGGTLPRVSSLKVQDARSSLSQSERTCLRFGWIDTREDADQLAAQFARPFLIQELDRELSPLNWVMIPPQPREAALAQFQDLYARGVESYVVTDGEYRNAISLGLFESRAAAESVFKEKIQQNLNVVLVNFPRNRIGYALVLGVEPHRETEMVQAVEAENHNSFDFVEIYACEGVASPEKNP
ncbi:hypothetical protein [Marinobacter halophilus]|uniref:SPOR domain-containing protein n=1 Tax=Marinobacter halophilus TaxID=1323740 RepID=A0A2T1KGF7_9GAMM|nr:hypothetical protein [Marinobacter halophilus]PSF09221.1 hypothetical protein C7H08_05385 [Marinobacter halophilus]GGC84044.1 hypothetical protein GCM10011362_35520 [Marinobacter halophilus]